MYYQPYQHTFRWLSSACNSNTLMFATVNGGGDHQRLRKVLAGRESQECVDVTQVN